MSCTICKHPERQAIDQALIAGSATLAALGQQYGLSTSALHRHKAHLQVKVNRAQAQLQDNLRQGCIFWLSQALEMAMQVARTAQTEGNSSLVLRALAQGTRLANIILKQDLNLDDRLVFELLSSPQWASQASLLPDDPGLLALGRQSLAATLASPCPEALPDGPSPASSDELALMQQFLQTLAPELSPQAAPGNRKPETANRPGKREKSGKKPGNLGCYRDEVEEYRLVELEKKIAQLDLDAPTRGLSPGAANDKIEAIWGEIYNSIPIPTDNPLSDYLHAKSLETNRVKNDNR